MADLKYTDYDTTPSDFMHQGVQRSRDRKVAEAKANIAAEKELWDRQVDIAKISQAYQRMDLTKKTQQLTREKHEYAQLKDAKGWINEQIDFYLEGLKTTENPVQREIYRQELLKLDNPNKMLNQKINDTYKGPDLANLAKIRPKNELIYKAIQYDAANFKGGKKPDRKTIAQFAPPGSSTYEDFAPHFQSFAEYNRSIDKMEQKRTHAITGNKPELPSYHKIMDVEVKKPDGSVTKEAVLSIYPENARPLVGLESEITYLQGISAKFEIPIQSVRSMGGRIPIAQDSKMTVGGKEIHYDVHYDAYRQKSTMTPISSDAKKDPFKDNSKPPLNPPPKVQALQSLASFYSFSPGMVKPAKELQGTKNNYLDQLGDGIEKTVEGFKDSPALVSKTKHILGNIEKIMGDPAGFGETNAMAVWNNIKGLAKGQRDMFYDKFIGYVNHAIETEIAPEADKEGWDTHFSPIRKEDIVQKAGSYWEYLPNITEPIRTTYDYLTRDTFSAGPFGVGELRFSPKGTVHHFSHKGGSGTWPLKQAKETWWSGDGLEIPYPTEVLRDVIGRLDMDKEKDKFVIFVNTGRLPEPDKKQETRKIFRRKIQ